MGNQAAPPKQSPSLGCARCGRCCDPIDMPLDFDPKYLNVRPGSDAETDKAFMLEHWTPHPDHSDASLTASLWQCDRFDPATRECTAHDERPPVCRGYPWYRDGPTPERAALAYSCCSFLLDVPPAWRPKGAWPLIPIEVIRR